MAPKAALLCAALLLPATALAQGKVRYDEDWSQLADPAQRTGAWTERFKYIPLGDEAYLTTGVELRVRSEAYRGNLWGDLSDDQATWVRALPYADLHVAKTRVFVQPIAAYATGIEGPVDQTRVDLLQAFAETTLTAKGASLTLRAGRQMMPLGSERLVGTRYGPNVPLAFDGWRAIVRSGSASLSLLAAQPVAPGPDSFDDRRSRTKQLWGAYLTTSGLELYYLGYRNRAADWGGRQGRELRHSFGARWFGEHGGTHWNVEGVAQRGRFAGGTIGAWTLATEIGRRFPGPIEPDATLRISIASGDKNPHDKRLGTFNALFPKGKYFGELSPIGPYNIISANPQISAALAKDWSASLAAMAYWRFSRGDGIYDVPGNLIRTGDGAAARFIGKQAEAVLSWQATPELELSASLSAFAPGAFIRETGPHRTIAMLGFESEFRF